MIVLALFVSTSLTAQTRHLTVEPNHSTIGFNISIAGFTKVTGKFTEYDIAIDWNDSNLDSCSISAVIDVSSINTGIPDRDEHLRTADFFDVQAYPDIEFVSDKIRRVIENNFEADGKLTMHGVTKDITLPFQIVKADGNTIGFKSLTTVNRLDYGVGTEFKHTAMPDFLSEEVEFECYFWTKPRKN